MLGRGDCAARTTTDLTPQQGGGGASRGNGEQPTARKRGGSDKDGAAPTGRRRAGLLDSSLG